MKTSFNNFINETDNDPFFSHSLRMEKGYKPKYRQGLIAVHFLDDENKKGSKYKLLNDDGGLFINYQDEFSKTDSEIISHFEYKYDIKLSDYDGDDYFIYFKCEIGKEKEKIEEIAKDKYVKVVDYVDIRGNTVVNELEDIIEKIEYIAGNYTSEKNEKSEKDISDVIERLKKLI